MHYLCLYLAQRLPSRPGQQEIMTTSTRSGGGVCLFGLEGFMDDVPPHFVVWIREGKCDDDHTLVDIREVKYVLYPVRFSDEEDHLMLTKRVNATSRRDRVILTRKDTRRPHYVWTSS